MYRVIPDTNPSLTVCWMEDKPGELRRCIRGVSEANLPVQIYSEEVRTPQTLDSGTGG